ncbi:MAG: SPASM domain-containing protein [bacterium]
MYDIEFYMKSYEFMNRSATGCFGDKQAAAATLESYRNRDPIVYNIETTNACNMRCKMCPRTTMMTRSVATMNKDLFCSIVGQLKPFSSELWRTWEQFVVDQYGVLPGDASENHFFLYIIPKVIQLHGYGDPLLDLNMPAYVKLLASRGLQSYFSCNPANIDIDKTVQMFENGLNYIKYSIESVDDTKHKEIRGEASDFSESYRKICQLLDMKRARNFHTVIVITMLNLNRRDQAEEFRKLRTAFSGKDVYIYLKSEDQQWYRKDYHGTQSIHWSECCKHPWMSMTIKSNGEACMCMEDFNNEIVLGDATREHLSDIWNGAKYQKFRHDHIVCTPGLKCAEQCDMRLIGESLDRTPTVVTTPKQRDDKQAG